ncbi:hypothetical protein LSAT2_011755, partial [Lamellibrachia satsuma]
NYLHQVVDTCDVLTPECRVYVRQAAKFHIEATLRQEISSCRMVARTSFNVRNKLSTTGAAVVMRALLQRVPCRNWLVVDGWIPESPCYRLLPRVRLRRKDV